MTQLKQRNSKNKLFADLIDLEKKTGHSWCSGGILVNIHIQGDQIMHAIFAYIGNILLLLFEFRHFGYLNNMSYDVYFYLLLHYIFLSKLVKKAQLSGQGVKILRLFFLEGIWKIVFIVLNQTLWKIFDIDRIIVLNAEKYE